MQHFCQGRHGELQVAAAPNHPQAIAHDTIGQRRDIARPLQDQLVGLLGRGREDRGQDLQHIRGDQMRKPSRRSPQAVHQHMKWRED